MPARRLNPIRRLSAFVVVVVASVGLVVQPAGADGGANYGHDNVVSVDNHTDGARLSRASVGVALDPGPTVDNKNYALAQSSCVKCRSVAAVIQVVVLEGPYPNFVPDNEAAAINIRCDTCQTNAYARQDFIDAGRRVTLGSSARRQISQIQWAMSALAASDASFDQMNAGFKYLADQLVSVVQGEVRQAGGSGNDTSREASRSR